MGGGEVAPVKRLLCARHKTGVLCLRSSPASFLMPSRIALLALFSLEVTDTVLQGGSLANIWPQGCLSPSLSVLHAIALDLYNLQTLSQTPLATCSS